MSPAYFSVWVGGLASLLFLLPEYLTLSPPQSSAQEDKPAPWRLGASGPFRLCGSMRRLLVFIFFTDLCRVPPSRSRLRGKRFSCLCRAPVDRVRASPPARLCPPGPGQVDGPSASRTGNRVISCRAAARCENRSLRVDYGSFSVPDGRGARISEGCLSLRSPPPSILRPGLSLPAPL